MPRIILNLRLAIEDRRVTVAFNYDLFFATKRVCLFIYFILITSKLTEVIMFLDFLFPFVSIFLGSQGLLSTNLLSSPVPRPLPSSIPVLLFLLKAYLSELCSKVFNRGISEGTRIRFRLYYFTIHLIRALNILITS